MTRTAQITAAAAAAAGMSREAFRVRAEWRGLLITSGLLAEAEATAINPATGRLIPEAGQRVAALRRSCFEFVVALLGFGVPAEVIATAIRH